MDCPSLNLTHIVFKDVGYSPEMVKAESTVALLMNLNRSSLCACAPSSRVARKLMAYTF